MSQSLLSWRYHVGKQEDPSGRGCSSPLSRPRNKKEWTLETKARLAMCERPVPTWPIYQTISPLNFRSRSRSAPVRSDEFSHFSSILYPESYRLHFHKKRQNKTSQQGAHTTLRGKANVRFHIARVAPALDSCFPLMKNHKCGIAVRLLCADEPQWERNSC